MNDAELEYEERHCENLREMEWLDKHEDDVIEGCPVCGGRMKMYKETGEAWGSEFSTRFWECEDCGYSEGE